MRREPIAGVPHVDLRQGHLPIHVQELTVRCDLAFPARRRTPRRGAGQGVTRRPRVSTAGSTADGPADR
jgi:hypothetical protein